MSRWMTTDDQGFEGTLQEAKQTLEDLARESGKTIKLWKLVWEATVENTVSLVRAED